MQNSCSYTRSLPWEPSGRLARITGLKEHNTVAMVKKVLASSVSLKLQRKAIHNMGLYDKDISYMSL